VSVVELFIVSILEPFIVSKVNNEKNYEKNTRKARNTRNTICYALYPLVCFHLKKMNEKNEKFLTNTRKARNTRNA